MRYSVSIRSKRFVAGICFLLVASPICSSRAADAPADLAELLVVVQTSENDGEIRDAAYKLAQIYAEGRGVPKNEKAAYDFYRKAAERGLAAAQYETGRCLSAGIGTEKNQAEALDWWKKAASQGHVEALEKLREGAQARVSPETAVEKSPPKAGQEGDEGIRRGPPGPNGMGAKMILEKFLPEKVMKSAEAGDAEAQFILSQMYARGRGVERDMDKAIEWARKSGEQGFLEAQLFLGRTYVNGDGVAQDKSQGKKWFAQAADQVEEKAKAGDPEAMLRMGMLYINGEGVRQDFGKARTWVEKAAKSGNQRANEMLLNMPPR